MSIEVFKIGNEHKDFMEHKEEEWVRYSDYSALTSHLKEAEEAIDFEIEKGSDIHDSVCCGCSLCTYRRNNPRITQ